MLDFAHLSFECVFKAGSSCFVASCKLKTLSCLIYMHTENYLYIFFTSFELHWEACWPAMNPTRAALPLGLVASKVIQNGHPVEDPATISPEKPFSFQKACREIETVLTSRLCFRIKAMVSGWGNKTKKKCHLLSNILIYYQKFECHAVIKMIICVTPATLSCSDVSEILEPFHIQMWNIRLRKSPH